jgi:microcystin-dependent protein
MADPTTSNRSLNIPTTGSDVGTWGTSLNNNFSYIDQLSGGVVTKSASSSNITLSTSDIQNNTIRLTGVLTANIDLIFPTISAVFNIDNQTTGNFYIRAKMASGNTIGLPYNVTTIAMDGTNVYFVNMPQPGSYWDFGGNTAPPWIAACSVLPWLPCDGTVYNVSDFPRLGAYLLGVWGGNGTTTFATPPLQNKVRVSVKPSSPLITTAVSGLDGSTFGASSTSEGVTLTLNQMAAHDHGGNTGDTSPALTITGGIYGAFQFTAGSGNGSLIAASTDYRTIAGTANAHHHSITSAGGGQIHTSVQPTAIAGLTFIKT